MLQSADILTNLFHVGVFLIANVIFVYAIFYRLKLVSKGQKVANLAGIEARLRSFLFNVIFQQKLFKHPIRGIMHAFIFYGFIVYLVHTTSQMVAGNAWALFKINGIDPYEFSIPEYTSLNFEFTELQGLGIVAGLITFIGLLFLALKNIKIGKTFVADQNAGVQWLFLVLMLGAVAGVFGVIIGSGPELYEAVVQNFSLLVLFGLGYFAYRRWIRRANGLDIPSAQSAIVIGMIGTLMLSTLAGAGANAFLHQHAVSWVSGVSLQILTLLGMVTQNDAIAVRDFSWWLHLVAVYSFMMYVPTSKHAHLIFAPFNFFLIKDQPRGQMNAMNLETATVYGAGNVTELPWTSLLDGLSCIECGRCTVECPANRTGKPLDPKKIMVDVKHALVEHSKGIMAFKDEGAAPSPVIGDPYITDEELWGCTSCMACVEACPVGNNQLEAILEMRRNLVLVESRFPAQLQTAFNNMEKNSNPWGVGAHTRADWCSDLGVKQMAEDSQVDVLYWVGCAGSFDDRNKTIARSFVKIMQQANVNFGILGTEENCSGDSARRGGNEYLYQQLAMANIENFKKYNVKKIVTACPHCFNTIKNEYPQLDPELGGIEVKHHSDFIDDLVREGKIEMDESAVSDMKSRRAVYHDSCYLGRYNDIYDQPRSLVAKALGMDLAEASDHHKTSLCCGAGGAQMWMEEEYERVNNKRTGQLIDTGADTIATACPFCMVMMTDGVKAAHMVEHVKVLDVAEIVAAGMKGGTGPLQGGGFANATASAGHH